MEKIVEKVKDPVCGMWIDPATAVATSQHEGKTYHFCAKGCKVAFDKEPAKYLQLRTSCAGCCGCR